MFPASWSARLIFQVCEYEPALIVAGLTFSSSRTDPDSAFSVNCFPKLFSFFLYKFVSSRSTSFTSFFGLIQIIANFDTNNLISIIGVLHFVRSRLWSLSIGTHPSLNIVLYFTAAAHRRFTFRSISTLVTIYRDAPQFKYCFILYSSAAAKKDNHGRERIPLCRLGFEATSQPQNSAASATEAGEFEFRMKREVIPDELPAGHCSLLVDHDATRPGSPEYDGRVCRLGPARSCLDCFRGPHCWGR